MNRLLLVFCVTILSSSIYGMEGHKKKSPTPARSEKDYSLQGTTEIFSSRPGLLSGSESMSEEAEEQPIIDEQSITLKCPRKKGTGCKTRQRKLKNEKTRSLKQVNKQKVVKVEPEEPIKVEPLEEIEEKTIIVDNESSCYNPFMEGIGCDPIEKMPEADIELSPREKRSKIAALVIRKRSK